MSLERTSSGRSDGMSPQRAGYGVFVKLMQTLTRDGKSLEVSEAVEHGVAIP